MNEKSKECLEFWLKLARDTDRLQLHSVNGIVSAFKAQSLNKLESCGALSVSGDNFIEYVRYLTNVCCYEMSRNTWDIRVEFSGIVFLDGQQYEVTATPIGGSDFSISLERPVDFDISVFIADKKAVLDKFEREYRAKNAEDPEQYPLKRPLFGSLGWETQVRVIGGIQ